MNTGSLDAIAEAITSKSLPPVHLWNPAVTRDIDMRIERNGDWFYLGSKINRIRMVKLFSTVLRVDEGQTYLVTPQERLRIDVDDAPFTAVLVEQQGEGEEQSLVLTTNLGDNVTAGEQHPISVEYKVIFKFGVERILSSMPLRYRFRHRVSCKYKAVMAVVRRPC
jgi:hypothetical protein